MVIYTYYNQKNLIPIIKKQGIETLIIDDCSTEPLKQDGFKVARISDDIKWNQPGARNLGFHLSQGWIISSDIDHIVTRENIDFIEKMKPQRGTVYYLGRKKPNGKIQSCTQSFLMHKDDFEEIGGYDEDFCGHYGHDDNLFNDMLNKRFKIENINTEVIDLSEIGSTKGNRELDHNLNLYLQKKDLLRNEGKRLRFTYKITADFK